MVEKTKTPIDGTSQTEFNIDELGIGAPKFFDFECKDKKDSKYEYRWCAINKMGYYRMKRYEVVTKEECDRIKPFFGEFVDGAWHLFRGSKENMVLMRCPKNIYKARRAYYGNVYKDNIRGDKERLKDIGRQNWRKGDSIKPDQVIVDDR